MKTKTEAKNRGFDTRAKPKTKWTMLNKKKKKGRNTVRAGISREREKVDRKRLYQVCADTCNY